MAIVAGRGRHMKDLEQFVIAGSVRRKFAKNAMASEQSRPTQIERQPICVGGKPRANDEKLANLPFH